MVRAIWPAVIASLLATTLPAVAAAPADPAAGLRDRLSRLEGRMATARQRMLDAPLDRGEVDLALAKMALDTASLLSTMREDPKRVTEWLDKARTSLDQAEVATLTSRTVEARGLFLDAGAMPRTAADVHALMERLAAAHFNMVVPEVFRRGYTIYPSRFTERDPEFATAPADLLQTFVSEAHRYGIEVHPWIWTFRVKSPGFGDPVLSRLPALAARSDKTADPRFLSPGDPRSRAWVVGLVDELTDRYDCDGLLLDYVRYDELTPDDWNSRTYFGLDYYARHGVFPSFPLKPTSPEGIEYQVWREEQVNQTVRALSERLKAKNPHFLLSAATFRGERYARLSKLQNWRHWSNNGWIDFDTSMLYTPKSSDLVTWLGWETDNWTRTNLLYAILGPLRMDNPVKQTLEQVETLHDRHIPGILLFSMSHLTPGVIEALGAGPFRRPAMLPHHEPIHGVRRTLIEIDNEYLAGVQVQADADTAASAAVLREELKKLVRTLPTGATPYYLNDSLIKRLESVQSLVQTLQGERHLPAPVGAEVMSRLDYAIALTQANAQRLATTRYVPMTAPPLPAAPAEVQENRE